MEKKILKGELYTICDEILKEIIEPSCGYCGITVDYWMADIQMFTLDDEVLDEEILNKIQEKYNLSDADMLGVDTFTPMIQLALYIYLGSERPQYPEIEE